MFKFLFRNRKSDEPEVVIEPQRDTFRRLTEELNALIDTLPDKPRVTIDPTTGHILPEPPEQFPDEALALPSPADGADAEPAATDAAQAGDAEPPAAEKAG